MTSNTCTKLIQRVPIKHISKSKISDGQNLCLKGWIRSVRTHKDTSFVDLNDGSCFESLQIVMSKMDAKPLTIGTCASIEGTLVASTPKKTDPHKLPYEVHAQTVSILGPCDHQSYPLKKKYHTLEFVREHLHLRPRTNTFNAVTRIRNTLSQGLHTYFQRQDFLQLHTPILTSVDCEGAGEQFQLAQDAAFFTTPTYLTVSGQLHAEMYACALSKVYTFGPTFRAENSHTSRHLSEFWMVEPEMAFADLQECMHVAQECVQFSLSRVLDDCASEIRFLNDKQDSELITRLEATVARPFPIVSYTEAISILDQAPVSFQYPVQWGADLQTEHERYLSEAYFKGPVFVVEYPKAIKPFYMRESEPQSSTVDAMDLLVPRIGELIGGSVREERQDHLKARMQELSLYPSDTDTGATRATHPLQWYLDLRKFGSAPHAGFGLGFERLVLYATGLSNIRDAIPIPRVPGSCPY